MTVTNCLIGGVNPPGASRTDLTLANSVGTSGGGLGYTPGDPAGRTPSVGHLVIRGTTFEHNQASSMAAGGGGLDVYTLNLGTGWKAPTVTDVDFYGVNGWCVEGVATVLSGQTYGKGYYGLLLSNLRGEHNGGGIHLNSSTTIDRNVQGAISNINLQTCQTGSIT